jgi:DNA-binding transcriptional regulator YhcF (GntR family)
MTLQVVVDTSAAVPVYEQIRSQLAGAIADGRLADGQRLPSVRSLAADLGIAANTVGRAYTELEGAGLIASRRRTGTIVTAGSRPTVPAEVLADTARLARSAASARLTTEQAVDLLRSAMLSAG